MFKQIIFLLCVSSIVYSENIEYKKIELFKKAKNIEIEQEKTIKKLNKAIKDIDKTILNLRDAYTGCLILDEECSHRKHIEWMKNFNNTEGK